MQSKEIKLNGGPWHGRVLSIPAEKDHFHIVGHELTPAEFSAEAETPVETVHGMYSVVKGEPSQFEWDGWVGH